MAFERVLDVSKLDPPAPLQQALAAADALMAGEFVRLKVDREPVLLYPLLVTQGYSHISRASTGSCFDVFIWRSNDEEAEGGVQAVMQREG